MIVRRANDKDVPRLVEMAFRFHHEWDFEAKLKPDAETSRAYFLGALNRPDMAVYIAEEKGRPVGTIALLFAPSPFSPASLAIKSFWYAEPEHPGLGRRLLQFGEIIARAKGCAQFHVASMHPRVNTLLQREGFTEQERSFYKDL